MIEMDDTIRAIVFQQFADKADFMCAINLKEDGYHMMGRVRFYGQRNEDPFTDDDRKKWFSRRTPGESFEQVRDEVYSALDQMMEQAVRWNRVSPNPERFILERKPGWTKEDFLDAFRKLPFVHAKVIKNDNGTSSPTV